MSTCFASISVCICIHFSLICKWTQFLFSQAWVWNAKDGQLNFSKWKWSLIERLHMKCKEEMQKGRVSRVAKCPSFCCCNFAWAGQGEILPFFLAKVLCSLWPYNTSKTRGFQWAQVMLVEAHGEWEVRHNGIAVPFPGSPLSSAS